MDGTVGQGRGNWRCGSRSTADAAVTTNASTRRRTTRGQGSSQDGITPSYQRFRPVFQPATRTLNIPPEQPRLSHELSSRSSQAGDPVPPLRSASTSSEQESDDDCSILSDRPALSGRPVTNEPACVLPAEKALYSFARGRSNGDFFVQGDMVQAPEQIPLDARRILVEQIDFLGLALEGSEKEIVVANLPKCKDALSRLANNRQKLLQFVRESLPNEITYSGNQPRMEVIQGKEFTVAARYFSRYKMIRPWMIYLTADEQRQAGIDAGGLSKQFWTNTFEQMAQLPVMTTNEQEELEIKFSTLPIPKKDLNDARHSGQIMAAAYVNKDVHKIRFVQRFEPRVYDALDSLDFSKDVTEFKKDGFIHRLYRDCVAIHAPSILKSIKMDDPDTAAELCVLIRRFLSDYDTNGRMSEMNEAGKPKTDVERLTCFCEDLKAAYVIESSDELIELIKNELSLLIAFVSGFHDVYSMYHRSSIPSFSGLSLGDRVRKMQTGKTIYEYLNPDPKHRGVIAHKNSVKRRSDRYLRVKIEDSAYRNLGLQSSDDVGIQLVASQVKKHFLKFVSDSCNNRSPENRKRAKALLKFITGSQTVIPKKTITIRVVGEAPSGALPYGRTCFNRVDLPVSMLLPADSRPDVRNLRFNYCLFRDSFEQAIPFEGFDGA